MIWNAIRRADFRKEGTLNDANIQLVFDKNKETIYQLTKIQTVSDFIDVFDRDKDGFLNEDEQISIFSLIKEKMALMAEELCKIHEYQTYKELMKEVRELEGYITIWQNELRENIQKRQLTEYIEIGDEKLKEFFTSWEQNFADFEQQSLDKMEELKTRAEQEVEDLNMRLDQSIKVKPSSKLKEMQCQEKLVAINERIEEAQNYRKELKDFEVAESFRVQKERELTAEKER